jgi:hypothetical protein
MSKKQQDKLFEKALVPPSRRPRPEDLIEEAKRKIADLLNDPRLIERGVPAPILISWLRERMRLSDDVYDHAMSDLIQAGKLRAETTTEPQAKWVDHRQLRVFPTPALSKWWSSLTDEPPLGMPGPRGYSLEALEYALSLRQQDPSMKVHAIRQRCLEKFSEDDLPDDDHAFRAWLTRKRKRTAHE